MAEVKEEQLTIDLPTEGDEVEIELEEQKTSAPEENKQEELQEQVEETTTDKEVEDQATSVQKRIDKLTRKMREAERQREEAIRFAQHVQEENQKIKQESRKLDKGYVDESNNRIESQMEAVKEKLKAAISAGDVDSQIQANELLARLAAENERYKLRQKEFEDEEQTVAQSPRPVQQQQEDITPDLKAQKWLAKNTWFAESTAMRETALDIHRDLLQEGFDVSSDEYYSEIDKRIREEFPHKFEDAKQIAQKPVQTVASANRTASNNGRKKVRLSPSQVAIAKKLKVPLSEYAKYVKE
jgi:hypothetical protein